MSAGARRIRFKRVISHPVVWVVVLNIVSLSAEFSTLVRVNERAINRAAAASRTGKLINRIGLEIIELVSKAGW